MEIDLTGKHGGTLLFDPEDLELVSSRSWSAQPSHNTMYAQAKIGGKVVRLHRLLMDFPAAQVDHVNGNGLDNRRSNLRPASHGQNRSNSRPANGTKGVYQRPSGRWSAHIRTLGQQIHLGTFDTERQALAAYDEAATKYHGEFARINNKGE